MSMLVADAASPALFGRPTPRKRAGKVQPVRPRHFGTLGHILIKGIHKRAVATRYDKRDDNYLASVKLASVRIWLRFNESVT